MKQCHGVQEYLSLRKKHFVYEDLCKMLISICMFYHFENEEKLP